MYAYVFCYSFLITRCDDFYRKSINRVGRNDQDTYLIVGVFLLWLKGGNKVLIIRVKDIVSNEEMEKIRNGIKYQASEGFIVHDDSIEITIVNDMCPECGSNDIEEITYTNGYADTIIKCERCNHWVDRQ